MTRDSDKMTCKEACTYLTVKDFMYLFPKLVGGGGQRRLFNGKYVIDFTFY